MFAYDILLLGAPSGAGGTTNPLISFLPLIAIFVVFYLFIIRPQKKKEDQRKQLIESSKKGDRIITIGGMHGKIVQVDETSVLIEVDTNTKVRIEKHAIASVVTRDTDKPAA